MSESMGAGEAERTRIMIGLLESVERNSAQSQRHLATELGIALGLVNTYLKRCVKKGLLKVRQAPARRYAYYLTPQGFAEKSRLTVEYLSYSFSFLRQARVDCTDAFGQIQAKGGTRVALAGASDLAEIARICALECGVEIVVVVDSDTSIRTHVGVPVVRDFASVPSDVDVILITDLRNALGTFKSAVEHFGAGRVTAPKILGLRAPAGDGEAA